MTAEGGREGMSKLVRLVRREWSGELFSERAGVGGMEGPGVGSPEPWTPRSSVASSIVVVDMSVWFVPVF